MTRKILILGGYGTLGILIVRYLAMHCSNVELFVGGRDLVKAKAATDMLGIEIPDSTFSPISVDASDPASLKEAFKNINVVVVASSTLKYVENVARVAIETGTDYLDTQLSSPFKLEALRKMEGQIIDSGRIFITDGGFHPGLLAAIVRWAHIKIGPLKKANIYGALKLDWGKLLVNKETIIEMVDEFRYFNMSVLRNGKWVKTKYNESVNFNFGDPFDRQYCVPMLIEELRMLSNEFPNLKEAGFYITGFNKLLDYVLFPMIMGLVYMNLDSLAASLFMFGLRFSRPPFGVKLIADCEGDNGEMRISFKDIDGYILTAIPVVACLIQYLDGALNKPGLYWQSWVVQPERFFNDMKGMGLEIQVSPVD
jgi:saccharopine dehydrogenase (NAD+, L-lysine-forming)